MARKPTTVCGGQIHGKDYPVTGDPTSDTRSIKQIDDHIWN